MTALKKITGRAKQIRKKQPGKSWQSCIKQASNEYKRGTLGATLLLEKNETRKTKPKNVVKITRAKTGTFKKVQSIAGTSQPMAVNGIPNEQGKTNLLPAKPKLKISIPWGPGENKKGYLVNEGDHGAFYLQNNPIIKKVTGKKYTIIKGGFLMAAVLKKYGYEPNAGGSLFIPNGYTRATGQKNFNGLTWKKIKELQKKY